MQDGQKLCNDYITLDAYFRTLDQNPELLAQANKSIYANKNQHTEEFNNAFPLVARRTSLAVGVVEELGKRFETQNNQFTNPKELYKWMLSNQNRSSYPKADFSEDAVSATKRGFNIEFVLHDWHREDCIGYYTPMVMKWKRSEDITPQNLITAVDTFQTGKDYDHEAYTRIREISAYITFQSDEEHKKYTLINEGIKPTNKNVQAYQQAVADHERRHLIDHLLGTLTNTNTTLEMQAELYWHPYSLLHYTLTDKLHRDVKERHEQFETQKLVGEDIEEWGSRSHARTIKQSVQKKQQELETLQQVTKTTIDICNNTAPHTRGALSYLFSTTNIIDLPTQIKRIRPYIDETPQQEPQETLQL